MSVPKLIKLKCQFEELENNQFIQTISSSWGPTALFVKKVDGSLRLCIKYRKLNDWMIKNRYSLPKIDDLFDQLSGARVFSQLDLAMEFHHLRVSKESIPLTASKLVMFYMSGK